MSIGRLRTRSGARSSTSSVGDSARIAGSGAAGWYGERTSDGVELSTDMSSGSTEGGAGWGLALELSENGANDRK
jgi:hypothetical protein